MSLDITKTEKVEDESTSFDGYDTGSSNIEYESNDVYNFF